MTPDDFQLPTERAGRSAVIATLVACGPHRSQSKMHLILCLFSVLLLQQPVAAATAFASPLFADRWQEGEMILPNFWGSLVTAQNGIMERYDHESQAIPPMRLVQYFDKGRMELEQGRVTFGNLTSQMILGQIVLGESTNQACRPPAIAIAGDFDPRNPTYGSVVAMQRGNLLVQTPQQTNGYPKDFYDAAGQLKSDPLLPLFQFTAYDNLAHHNIPKVFADYRDQANRFQATTVPATPDPALRFSAGEAIIGIPLSEPFLEMVSINGVQVPVFIQVFTRRVLTYNAANPDPYKVEMNNAGQHYYFWRYGGLRCT